MCLMDCTVQGSHLVFDPVDVLGLRVDLPLQLVDLVLVLLDLRQARTDASSESFSKHS